MPDLANRNESESRVAEAIAGAHQQALNRIKEQAGNPPDEFNLNDAFWSALILVYQDALYTSLQEVYADAVAGMNAQFERTLDLTNEGAAWAAAYSAQLASQLVSNRKTFTLDAFAKMREKGWTPDELWLYLLLYFGIDNALTIAITEVTNAVSEAERQYISVLTLLIGALVEGFIETARDDRVCPICSPKDGVSVLTAGYPPFHIRCRCTVVYPNPTP